MACGSFSTAQSRTTRPASSTAQAQWVCFAASIPMLIFMENAPPWLVPAHPVSPASPYTAIEGIA